MLLEWSLYYRTTPHRIRTSITFYSRLALSAATAGPSVVDPLHLGPLPSTLKVERYAARAACRRRGFSNKSRRWPELEDEQILAFRTELGSYRLNGSGMNKIVRSTSPNLFSINR